jgi:hypothetical protein
MPMMRDTGFLLSECFRQVRDHRPQIRARGQRLLQRREGGRPLRVPGCVPALRQRPPQSRLLLGVALAQAVALLDERGPGAAVERAGLGLGQRFLDLEHLGQESRRRLWSAL